MRLTAIALLSTLLVISCSSGNSDPNLHVGGDWGAGVDGGVDSVYHPDSIVKPKDLNPGIDAPDNPADLVEKDAEEPVPGQMCNNDGDCVGGPCVPTPDGLRCSIPCEDDCPVEGWRCVSVDGEWAPGLCLRPDWLSCMPCETHNACYDDWSGKPNSCIDYPDGGRYCALKCNDDGDCAEGYSCKEAKGAGTDLDGKWCVADQGSCQCGPLHEGAQTACIKTNEFGSCHGLATCTNRTLVCVARSAKAETCNNLDDDCDSVIDEDIPAQVCGQGPCEHAIPGCQGGAIPYCNPMDGSTQELCNGLDDNCNGVVDELWPLKGTKCDSPLDPDLCANGTWICSPEETDLMCADDVAVQDEVCNGLDDDCDGQIDEGLGVIPCGVGECFRELPACENGAPAVCIPDEGAEETDLPDSLGLDTNCDGIDGVMGQIVFVDGAGGDDLNPGTMDQPMATISAGLLLAQDQGKDTVFISEGTYAEEISVFSGLKIKGSLVPEQSWIHESGSATVISGGQTALHCLDAVDVSIIRVDLRTESGTSEAPNSIAASLTNCQIAFSSCDITSGSGAAGGDGTTGAQGAVGGDGSPGVEGCFYGCIGGCNSDLRPQGGLGGATTCGAFGGQGGQGGKHDEPGFPGAVGFGGAAGGPGGALGQDAGIGEHGLDGANGQPGSSNSWAGQFTEAGYIPGNGVSGGDGQPGAGGGGGGGGGGNNGWLCSKKFGSSGGGGGAGGCGGKGGSGGKGGGASLGLYLVNSQVSFSNGSIVTGAGGKGGDGKPGGPGGAGGIGGPGVKGSDGAGDGGNAGNGGNGGNGGFGGAGDGGPTIGVVCVAGSTFTQQGSNLVPGLPGQGGNQANGGPAGYKGLNKAVEGCPL